MDDGETEPSLQPSAAGVETSEAVGNAGAPRGVSAAIGTFLLLFGSVFFFIPLAGLIMALSSAEGLGEMVFLIAFFGVFLIVGGVVMFLGGAALYHAVTGRALLNINFGPQEDDLIGAQEGVVTASTAFEYTTREALLAEIHGEKTPTAEGVQSPPLASEGSEGIEDQEGNEERSVEGAFWDVPPSV
jgi:hypothetical protein